jgi:ribose-phosphate pyrophosphokinase
MRNPVFTSTAIRLGFADEQRVDQLTVPSTAESIAVFAPAASGMLGAKIAADLGLPLSAHEEREFTGREYKMRALQSVRDRSVYVVQSLFGDSRGSANDRLCQLLFFVGALKDAGAERVTACVPYLAYARQDRRSEAHDPITARYIAQLFEAMGVDRVLVLEVHNLAAFDNAFRCRTVHLEAAALFVRHFAAQSVDHEFAVVSPDIGGVKRARHFQEQLEQAVGHAVNFALMDKKRSRGGVTGTLFAGDVAGRCVIVLDDLISSGTTAARAIGACRRADAVRVELAATHASFAAEAHRLFAQDPPDKVVVTDSVDLGEGFLPYLQGPLAVLSVAPLFAEAIRRLEHGGSLSELGGL